METKRDWTLIGCLLATLACIGLYALDAAINWFAPQMPEWAGWALFFLIVGALGYAVVKSSKSPERRM